MKQFIFKKLLPFFSLALIISSAIASLALAADLTFTPQVGIPGSKFEQGSSVAVNNNTLTLCEYLQALYKYGIGIIGILAVISVAVGGVMWVISGGNSGKISKAKTWITDGLYGLALAMLSFLILGMINVNLVVCKNVTIANIGRDESRASEISFSSAYNQPAVTLDDSGKNYCCVANGLWNASVVFEVSVPANFSKLFPHQDYKSCATIASADKEKAQKACNEFYRTRTLNINENLMPGGISTYYLKPQVGTNNEENSATITDGACYDTTKNKAIYDWCRSAQDPKYCENKSKGTECKLFPSNANGYCENDTCNYCIENGKECSYDEQCVGTGEFKGQCGINSVYYSRRAGMGDCDGGLLGTGIGKGTCIYKE